jgi:hypothetical protein
MVPYDPRGLFDAMGGDAAVRGRLDMFFSQLNAGNTRPFAFLSNEPSSEAPWLYDFAGAPYRTQAIVRQALNTLWRPTADGFVGNDDLGQMAAWYIWGALGIYPEIPGRAELTVGSPLFAHILIKRPTGQSITIDAPGASADTFYVQSLNVNGAPTTKPWLPESFVHSGGTLSFAMGTTPNTAWGADAADAPPSFREGEVPYRTAVDPGHVVAAPGGPPVVAHLTVQSIGGGAGTVSWTANPPAGITVTPASGTIALPASGPVSTDVTVSAAAGLTAGFYRAPIALTAPDGRALPPATLSLTVAQPNSVFANFNNTGVSADDNPGQADLDGSGFSYSAQALVAAGVTPGGQLSAAGFTFTWPADPVALPDNIMVGGGNQTINLSGSPTQLALLGCGTNGNASGTLTVTYADGTTQTAQVGLGDWVTGNNGGVPQFGDSIAARMLYRNGSAGMQQAVTYTFATAPVTLAGKPITSVTLPSSTSGGDMHVFAVATG